MPREVTDREGTTWACVEAYAGLAEGGEGKNPAPTDRGDGLLEVVCTPSGGARTVRLGLAREWESKLSDEELLREIESRRGETA